MKLQKFIALLACIGLISIQSTQAKGFRNLALKEAQSERFDILLKKDDKKIINASAEIQGENQNVNMAIRKNTGDKNIVASIKSTGHDNVLSDNISENGDNLHSVSKMDNDSNDSKLSQNIANNDDNLKADQKIYNKADKSIVK